MSPNEISLSSELLVELIRPVLAKGASFRFQVKGWSMLPFIMDDDVATISPLNNSLLRFGQPVAFINPCSGKLTIHRLVGKKSNAYIIKGDSVLQIDGFIPRQNILGVITKIERDSRSVRFGLGPERLAIGLCSKLKLFSLCLGLWNLMPFSTRRFIKCTMRL